MPSPFYTANKRGASREAIEFPLGGKARGKANVFGMVIEEPNGTYTLKAGRHVIRGLIRQDLACFRDAMVELVVDG